MTELEAQLSEQMSNFLKENNLTEAEALCNTFILKYPKKPQGYFQKSIVCMRREEWQNTITLLDTAIRFKPNEADFHANKGAALYMLKNYHEAEKSLERSLALNPNNVNSLNNLAVVYSLLHKYTQAEELLQHSLQLDPHQADTWLNLCSTVQSIDFREDDVVRYAKEAIKLRPRDPNPYTYLGKALLKNGDPKAALEAMKIATMLDGSNPNHFLRIGICHLQLDQIPEAIDAFQEALRLNPEHGETFYALANFLHQIEDHPAALEAGLHAMKFSDGAHKILAEQLLSEILFVSGHYDDAQILHDNQLASYSKLQIHPKAKSTSVVAAVTSVEQWCLEQQLPFFTIIQEREWETHRPIVFGDIPVEMSFNPITIPKTYVAEIENALIFPGHEIFLVDDKKIALYDRLMQFGDWHCMRPEGVLSLISNDHVMIDAPPVATKSISNGIFLMSEVWYNYAHWLTEQISRIFLIDQDKKYEGIPILVNEGIYPQQREALELVLEGRHPIQTLKRDQSYTVQKLVYPSILSGYHKRRYRDTEKATPSDGPCHPEAINFVRHQLLKPIPNKQLPRKRLWISRKKQLKSGQRRLLNETEIEALFVANGFEAIQPETLSLKEQIALFSQAEMIAAPAGAALMNMIFAPADTKILILTKNHPQVNYYYFTNVAQIIGQPIAYVTGEGVKNFGVLGFETDFSIDINKIKASFKHFLCI